MINNTLFRPSAIRENRKKFNPEGFDLTEAVKARQEAEKAEYEAKRTAPPPPPSLSVSHLRAFSGQQNVELVNARSESEATIVIRAAYKQVFGNAHLMESERFPEAESQLRSGEITVMEFVRLLAKSDQYRARFVENYTNLSTIEFNFKHLLGRAPESYAEISEHIQIIANEGWSGEIDSYIDSDEYFNAFGTNIVPNFRGYQSQVGKNVAGFTHSFQLLRGASSSDKSITLANELAPQLQSALISNQATSINPLTEAPPEPLAMPPFKSTVNDPCKDLDLTSREYKTADFLSQPLPEVNWYQEYKAKEAAATFPAARSSQPVSYARGGSSEDLDVVIRAAYKQVFGNVHLMESQRLETAESQLQCGQITVQEFIKELALSDTYRELFFERCSNVRAVELNFKHLLGRAPDTQAEISEHIQIIAAGGFDAEINSYFTAEEYSRNFGLNTVPYYVGYSTQTGKRVTGYQQIFQLVKGACSSDRSIADTIDSSQKSQLQTAIVQELSVSGSSAFNPEGFDLATSLKPQPPSTAAVYKQALNPDPIEFVAGDSSSNLDQVIEAGYRQVFGNAHLMESERSPQIESQLRSGEITVLEFVRQLAKSDQYRSRFLEKYSNVRVIELNFKHLLGRAPESYEELSKHIQILATEGFEAEIDSYLDSDEYFQNFGSNIVPFYRGYETQTGQNLAGYTRAFKALQGSSSSDKSTPEAYAALDQSVLSNNASEISNISIEPLTIKTGKTILTPIDLDELDKIEIPVYENSAPGAAPMTDTTALIQKVLGLC